MFHLKIFLLVILLSPALTNAVTPVKESDSKMSKEPSPYDLVMMDPVKADPINWGLASAELLKKGDKLQAAFCFYVFQVRTLPHSKVAKDPTGMPALRASLNAMIGGPVNEWIFADPEELVKLVTKAIAFESHLDQSVHRPSHLTEADWKKVVEENRAAYKQGFLGALGTPEAKKNIKDQRKANGLYVGPLKDKGAPLRKEWNS